MKYISKIKLDGITSVTYEKGKLGVKKISIDENTQKIKIEFENKEWDYQIIPISDLHSYKIKEEDDGTNPYTTSEKKRLFSRDK